MQLSDTTNQTGCIQKVERETRRPYGSSGNELREIINDLNEAFDELAFILLARNDYIRWDDTNHTDKPTGKLDIIANQNDYKITVDDNSLDIYNILYVRVIHQTGDTQYIDLEKITLDDKRVPEILNPNTAITGQPTGYVEMGNKIFLDILPESAVTNGIEIGFSREQSRFTVTGTSGDDTTEPGIPTAWHSLLHKIASLKWLSINKPDDVNHITLLRDSIMRDKKELGIFVDLRNPVKNKMTNKKILYI